VSQTCFNDGIRTLPPGGNPVSWKAGLDLKEVPMPLFLIERNFAQKLQVTPEGASAINEINAEENVRWLISFLSIDKKKTFCLYEAVSVEAIRKAAERAGIPVDEIIEVDEEILPNGVTQKLKTERFV
jgi:hypothetical protein